jgi:hypothetical protein
MSAIFKNSRRMRVFSIIFALTLMGTACAAPTPVLSTPTEVLPTVTEVLPTQTQVLPTATEVLPTPTVILPTATATTAAAPSPTAPATLTPAGSSGTPQGAKVQVQVQTDGLAQSVLTEVVPAVSDTANSPYWEVLPEYTQLTLAGYPISSHLLKPQIFIYPAAQLAAANPGAGKIASDLKELLKTQQVGKSLPFMPLFNAQQVLHAQVKYLDFQNGKGVRFLTQFDQAPLPINNNELFYAFQGLTSDGKYYVAAVLPVNLAGLPADNKVTGQEPKEFSQDFPAYLTNMANQLNNQPAASFNPDLDVLDAMMESLTVK